MKVAVFGDSFAEIGNFDNLPSWVNFLQILGVDVTSYGVPGSPLYVSVENFEKYNEHFEKIIFVVTNPYRYELRGKNKTYYISSTDSIDAQLSKLEHYSEDWWMLTKCKEWLLIPNLGLEVITKHAHNAMIDHVRSIRPDAIIVPAFKNSIDESTEISLEEIQAKETETFEPNLRKKYNDLRICHLSTKNNQRLAKHFYDLLQGNDVKLSLDDYERITEQEFPRYFQRR